MYFPPLISSVQGAIQYPSHFIPPFRTKSTKFFVHSSSPRFIPQALFSLICTKLLSSPTVFCPTFCVSAPAKDALKLRVLESIPSSQQRPCLERFLPSHRRAWDRPWWEDGWTAQGHRQPCQERSTENKLTHFSPFIFIANMVTIFILFFFFFSVKVSVLNFSGCASLLSYPFPG